MIDRRSLFALLAASALPLAAKKKIKEAAAANGPSLFSGRFEPEFVATVGSLYMQTETDELYLRSAVDWRKIA